ncbi:MAG: amino acid adenylation domain-containing protein [Roseibium sp.]|uniref:non-ribosomal peptide synthetase n=1 Tax=Roseibium sp. TaxID=1936156 RepID=UPI001B15039E|nr:amino acid adenylation domain-containing protein [Roseibium sp.]MBO6893442.1 amino acid adenylation domain-containing protein [Roseibium sp.]MBO6930591.1 amino acid adenylation domain-containing protein [Roseibium sp.]
MKQGNSAEGHLTTSGQNIEFSSLWDAGTEPRAAASDARVETTSDTGWNAAIDALSSRFADASPSQIATAVFAAYAARVSENHQAVFALLDASRQDGAEVFSILEHEISAEETVSDLIDKMAAVPHASTVKLDPSQSDGLPLAVTAGSRSKVPVDTEIHLHCNADGSLTLSHPSSLDGEQIHQRLSALAAGIAANPDLPLVRQPIMSAGERRLVVETWNATDHFYGYQGGLVAMMEKQVHETPDHPALIFKEQVLSYAEFNARVNRLARQLREKGVGRDKFVALFMDRSLEMVIGLWAAIKAGGAYVPLNTEDPSGRLTEIIEDCKPVAVLTQDHLRDKIETDVSEVIVLPEGGDVDPGADGSDLGIEIGANDLAYMIYTSGSTGKPKGVVVEHEAIHNRVVWMHEEYDLEPQDRVLQKTPYTFDVSVWEFLWPFAVGSTLVVAIPGGHMSIRYLQREISQSGVTHLHFVPSMLRLFLLARSLKELPIKKLFCSGEALGFDLVQSFYEKASDQAEVHNLYGPTEAAVDVSYFACPRNPSDKTIPIGKPVTNTGLYVLDEYDQPVPVGVPGELHIGGTQLARGYWNREDLTSERFIPCPVEDAPHRRLYRTGDLAYFRTDGEIIYLGRNDFQVKISGVRIELGEIEAAIRTVSAVRDVVVVAEEADGQKSLVAYVVADTAGDDIAATIKTAVSDRCPPFYVPQEIRFLAEMPLTVSGKINRKLLKDQDRL